MIIFALVVLTLLAVVNMATVAVLVRRVQVLEKVRWRP